MTPEPAPPPQPFQYAVIRVVPAIEREEFVNVGVLVFCRTRGFLAAATQLDPVRLASLAPGVDLDVLEARLAAITRVAAGDPGAGAIAALPQSERFHWLAAPSSTLVQSSPIHSGLCADPQLALARLLSRLVST